MKDFSFTIHLLCKRAISSVVILLLSITSFVSCGRFSSPRPTSVPEEAALDRKTGFWTYRSSTETRIYSPTGKLVMSGPLKNGQRQGTWYSYASDESTIVTIGDFLNDWRNGTWKFYDGSGKLYQTLEYHPQPVRTFGFLITHDYGNENGPYQRFFPNGELEESGTFAGGYEEGIVRRYYKSGQLYMTGKMSKDARVGEWKTFYPNGKIQRIERFANGKLTGNAKSYFPNGDLYFEAEYEDGKLIRSSL